MIVINYLSKSVFSLISSGWAKGSEIMVPEISASEANRVTSESGERNWFYTLSRRELHQEERSFTKGCSGGLRCRFSKSKKMRSRRRKWKKKLKKALSQPDNESNEKQDNSDSGFSSFNEEGELLKEEEAVAETGDQVVLVDNADCNKGEAETETQNLSTKPRRRIVNQLRKTIIDVIQQFESLQQLKGVRKKTSPLKM